MAYLLDTGLFSVEDTDGSIGVGWKLNFYVSGTSNRVATYPTSADAAAGTNANANPVVIPADGRVPPIWKTGNNPKCVLTDEDDVVKETIDPCYFARLDATTNLATVAGTTHTFTLDNANGVVRFTSATAVTAVVPANALAAFGINDTIEMHQDGAGVVTFSAPVGVTILSRDGLYDTAGQYAVAGLRKLETNVWKLVGDLA